MISKIKDYFKKNKKEKITKQIKDKRNEYDKLKIKFDEGTINNNELNKYYKLKEELNKMAKKFIMKDGKIVLDNDSDEKQEPQVQEPQVQEPKQEETKTQESKTEEPQAQETQFQEPQAQESKQELPKNDGQLYERMKQEEQLQEEQARQEYLRMQHAQQAQQQERMQAQRVQAQQRQQQVQAEMLQKEQIQQPTQPQYLKLILFVQDIPPLSAIIEVNMVEKVIADIKEAQRHNDIFRLDTYFIMANKIIAYKFEEYDMRQTQQQGGN